MIEKAHTTKEISPPMNQYHFPGSGLYIPLTVTAVSREEAEKIWTKERKKVEDITSIEK